VQPPPTELIGLAHDHLIILLPYRFDLFELFAGNEIPIVLYCHLKTETAEPMIMTVDLQGVLASSLANHEFVDVYPVDARGFGCAQGVESFFSRRIG
jgi:hypothetical protein